jgi:hypothetical protein
MDETFASIAFGKSLGEHYSQDHLVAIGELDRRK